MPWKLTPNQYWKCRYLHFNNNLQIQLFFVLKYSPQSCTATGRLVPNALFFTPEQFNSLPLECQIHFADGKYKPFFMSKQQFKLFYSISRQTHPCRRIWGATAAPSQTKKHIFKWLSKERLLWSRKGLAKGVRGVNMKQKASFLLLLVAAEPWNFQRSFCHAAFKPAISDSIWSLQHGPAWWGHLKSELVIQQRTMTTFLKRDSCHSPESNWLQQLPGGEKQICFSFSIFFFFNWSSFNKLDKLFLWELHKPPCFRMSPGFKKTISFSVNLNLFEWKNIYSYFSSQPKKWQFITFTLIKKGLNFIDKLRQTFWQVLAT